jgi:hypothetical protein
MSVVVELSEGGPTIVAEVGCRAGGTRQRIDGGGGSGARCRG